MKNVVGGFFARVQQEPYPPNLHAAFILHAFMCDKRL